MFVYGEETLHLEWKLRDERQNVENVGLVMCSLESRSVVLLFKVCDNHCGKTCPVYDVYISYVLFSENHVLLFGEYRVYTQ